MADVYRWHTRGPSRRNPAALPLRHLGASFQFIKLGVDQLEPPVVVLGRLVVGVLVLLPLVE